jgi:tRNA A22 N-methylase
MASGFVQVSRGAIERVSNTVASLKKKNETLQRKVREGQAIDQALTVATIVGAGAVTGAARGWVEKQGKQFTVPGTSIDAELAIGLAAIGCAVFEVGGKKLSDHALLAGAAVLGNYARNVAKASVKTGSIQTTNVGATAPGAAQLIDQLAASAYQ